MGGSKDNARSYLVGEHDIPWWAVMLSILGTEISALTFVGVPAMAYTGNWTYLQMTLAAFTSRWIVGRTFVPAYYKYEVTSIYEFLEIRFGPRTRLLASLLFLVTRILMSGVRLYAGAILAQWALGISTASAILLLGTIGLIYTIRGGIKAVIWIEVIQVSVMFGGALISLAVLGLPHGLPLEKLQVIDLSLDPLQHIL